MQGGFSFCGRDIATFGLQYAPTLDQTYVYSAGQRDVQQEQFEAHHGAYFYGVTIGPKDFRLRCFFEGQHISRGILTSIEAFFRCGKTGRLIFKEREWLWYNATVISVDTSGLLNYQNGLITITLRAYYPFARHSNISLNSNNRLWGYIADNSGLMEEIHTPATSFTNITQNTDLLLYNGGTEPASVAIEIAGNAGEGILIKNHTTGHECKMIAFTKATTTDQNKYLICDAMNGKTVLTDGKNSQLAFGCHDYGFIELAPSCPIFRNMCVSYIEGSNEISAAVYPVTEDMIGKYIQICGAWRKIIDISMDDKLIIDGTTNRSGAEYTDMVQMNHISVELSNGAKLDKLNFVYCPTFM